MLMLKILAIPFKLAVKLLLYAVGGIIISINFSLLLVVRTFRSAVQFISGFLHIGTRHAVCLIVNIGLCIYYDNLMLTMGIMFGIMILTETFATFFPEFHEILAERLTKAMNKAMNIPAFIFRTASFRLL